MSLCHARRAQANHKNWGFFSSFYLANSLIQSSCMAYFTNRMQGEGKRVTLCFKHCKMEAARTMSCKYNVQLKRENNKQEKKQTQTGVLPYSKTSKQKSRHTPDMLTMSTYCQPVFISLHFVVCEFCLEGYKKLKS